MEDPYRPPLPLDVDLDTLGFIIIKAREFDVKVPTAAGAKPACWRVNASAVPPPTICSACRPWATISRKACRF